MIYSCYFSELVFVRDLWFRNWLQFRIHLLSDNGQPCFQVQAPAVFIKAVVLTCNLN